MCFVDYMLYWLDIHITNPICLQCRRDGEDEGSRKRGEEDRKGEREKSEGGGEKEEKYDMKKKFEQMEVLVLWKKWLKI